MLCSFSYGDNFKMIILKVKCTDKVDILYSLSGQKDELFDLHSPFVYSGIYDREKDKLYDTEYSIRSRILNWEYNDEKNITTSDLYKIINTDMNEKIEQLVNDNKEEIFNINEVELEIQINDYDVLNEFIDGKTSIDLKDDYKQYHTNNPNSIIDYLTDRKLFLEEEARDFIVRNSSEILNGLVTSAEKRKALRRIEENAEHPYHKIKNIVDAIKDNNCITVNLTINKNSIVQTFKYDADILKFNYDASYLSPRYIEKTNEKKLYEETYGKWEDFHYEDIVKITYGKKVIYEDNDFKTKEIREEICL